MLDNRISKATGKSDRIIEHHGSTPAIVTTALAALAAFSAALLIMAQVSLIAPGTALGLVTVAAIAAWSGVILSRGGSPGQNAFGTTATTAEADAASRVSLGELVSALPDPALLLSSSTSVIGHNEAAQILFGKSLADLPLEHVSRDPELIGGVERAFEAAAPVTVRIVQWLGGERHLMASIAPLRDTPNGRADAVLLTFRDLSSEHRALQTRADFVANASHELRTPLASVRGFIETLQGSARHDEIARKRFLSIMATQAARMSRLIDDLLLLSRVEEKAYLPPSGKVELNELITHVAQTLTMLAADKDVSIEISPVPQRAIVDGDRDDLVQVFQNLIENAIKYGRQGGHVWVETKFIPAAFGAKERIVISIADDGPGISPEHLPRLTERFYRVNADHSRNIGGTGLGLAIVKHVLNRHAAELKVESTVGQGTRFRVNFLRG
jgi:two-component system, OmpR family, phosphate regulon sensor histidine kinase PhoR